MCFYSDDSEILKLEFRFQVSSISEDRKINHTSFVEKFSEIFYEKAETCLIFFLGMHWFQKCNFWNFGFHLVFTSFYLEFGFRGCLTSARGSGFFSKIMFLKSVHSKEREEASLGFLLKMWGVKLVRLFFGRSYGSTISFWDLLTFRKTRLIS